MVCANAGQWKGPPRPGAAGLIVSALAAVLLAGCAMTPRAIVYTPADDFYFTLGDGRISDYSPVGYVCGHHTSLISDPASAMQRLVKEELPQKAKEIGGDGMMGATIEIRERKHLAGLLGEKNAIKVYIVDVCGQAIRLKRG